MNTTNLPLVSIIITSFNHEKYLNDCIESVINQTYTNLEILIVDNNSKDNSSNIISKYLTEDKRIRFYPQKENLFPSGAMNYAIRHAKGEYISMISGDDYCELNKIEIQIEHMLKNNLTNLFSWVNIVDDSNTIIENHPFNGLFNRVFLGEELEFFLVTHGNTLCAGSVLLYRSFIEKYGYFDNRLLQLQDYEMWLRLVSNEKINILQKKLFNYRVRNDNKNLSLNNEDFSVKFRSTFETVKIVNRILLLKNEFLSYITGATCNEDNKYKNLFNYYMKHDKKEFANGILLLLFDRINDKFTFPSPMYADFLEIYSNNDLFNFIINNKIIKDKDEIIKDKDEIIKDKDDKINHLEFLVDYLRLKSRIKRIMKKVIPSKIWEILKYIKNNHSSIKISLCTVKKIKEQINKNPLLINKFITSVKKQGLKATLNKVRAKLYQSERMEYSYTKPILTNTIKKEIISFANKPLISIIMPVYNIDPKWLDIAIKSIENQWYENWELCIADDKSTNQETIEYLKSIKNFKIKIKYLEKNLNISGASNAALELATGEYISLMDNDDEITPDALYEVIKAINKTNADFIYSDEDFITTKNECENPHFKPDFSPDLLLSHNYITHFTTFKKDLLEKVGNFNSEFDGAQDYDLFLRLTETCEKVYHIPKVLYHWRMLETSTSSSSEVKPEALNRAKRLLEKTLERRNILGSVENANLNHYFRIKYKILNNPLISIVIPFKDKPELLKMCIESILDKTTYKNFEVIGISNNSTEIETFNEMERLSKLDNRIKFYEYNYPFNYSAINNYAVNSYASGEHILLLNNDIEIINSEWLENMLGYSQQNRVGCVGAKLYYPNDSIQHAGIIMGLGGYAAHSHRLYNRTDYGYFNRLNVAQNLSAVTGACLMVKKSIYQKINGLDEENFKIAYNDVDFCLRVKNEGYLNIFTPFAEAYHHESISRGYEDTPEKIKRFDNEKDSLYRIHKEILVNGDPFYNINLTLDSENFGLK